MDNATEYYGMLFDGEKWITYADAVANCHNESREDQWTLLESLLEAYREGELEAAMPFKRLLDILMINQENGNA
jgi:hypothetical protein